MDLTDVQWKLIEPFIPAPKRKPGGRGRPPRDPRDVLNGILWVLRTGAQWKDLPDRYPPYQTCHRYLQAWRKKGVFKQIMQALANDLEERGGIDITESFIDGSFSSAKKGAMVSARPSVARAPRSWQSWTLLVFLSPSTWEALRLTK